MKSMTPLWGVWKLEENADELLAMLDNPAAYQLSIEKMHTEKRRQEWLGSRTALKEILGREVPISYQTNGAPYVEGLQQSISISHTKGYAAVLVSPHPIAGIDIEYRSDRVLKIRSRFMEKEEEAGLDPAHEVEHLLIHWCAKEALFKLIGQEEVDFVRHLHVAPFTYEESGFFIVKETRTAQSCSYRMGYRVESDYVLVWSI